MIIKIQNNFQHLLYNFLIWKGCVVGKQHKIPLFQGSNFQAKATFEFIHFDICGPVQKKSLNGSIYFATFINDYSQIVIVYFFKKFDVFLMF
jgi:hypothetical protein